MARARDRAFAQGNRTARRAGRHYRCNDLHTPPLVSLDALGRSNAAALRRLYLAVEDRGWRDFGSEALELVHFLETGRNRSRTPAACARFISSRFLGRNHLTRAVLTECFTDLARVRPR